MAIFINNCRKISLSSMQLLRSSSVASQIIARQSSYESKIFTGFNVIYCLDSIKTVSMINRMKRSSSIIASVMIPTCYGLESMSYLPYSVAGTVILSSFSIALFFHTVGHFCNNVVGFIYAKNDTDELVISYVDYWGKRVNVQTTFSDVDYLESKNYYFQSSFNKLNLPSCKFPLKVYSKGRIIDEGQFYKLLGI